MEGTQEVSTKALTVIEQANVLTIQDSAGYTLAGELWKNIKVLKEQVNTTFQPIIEKANAAHKEALAQKAKIFDPLDTASRTVKGAMETYAREQEQIRKAEEKRLQDIARKVEEERLLNEAISVEASGDKEEADAIIESPVYIPPIVIPKSVPKLNGGPVYSTRWDFEIIDAAKIPRSYMVPDLVKIRQIVTALKEQTNIDGVRVFSKRV